MGLRGICLIERLRTDPKIQPATSRPFHTFGDIGVALPTDDVKIGERIVPLAINNIVKRSNGREVFLKVTKDSFNPSHLIISDLKYHHCLARTANIPGQRVSDCQCSQKADLFSQVKERDRIVERIVSYCKPHSVGRIWLEMTFLYIKHPVVHSWDVISQSRLRHRVAGVQLFCREPPMS